MNIFTNLKIEHLKDDFKYRIVVGSLNFFHPWCEIAAATLNIVMI